MSGRNSSPSTPQVLRSLFRLLALRLRLKWRVRCLHCAFRIMCGLRGEWYTRLVWVNWMNQKKLDRRQRVALWKAMEKGKVADE